MPLITGQATIGTASTTLFSMPPSSAVVTINSGTASTATAYIGVGGAAGTANSFILDPGHAVTFASYTSSPAATVNAITTAGSAATLSWIISDGRS